MNKVLFFFLLANPLAFAQVERCAVHAETDVECRGKATWSTCGGEKEKVCKPQVENCN